MNKIFVIQKFYIFILFAMLFPFVTEGAEIYFDTKKQEVGIDSKFEVEVFLDTQGELINAIEGKIKFPVELIDVQSIRDGDSSISFWIESPQNDTIGQVSFAGLIPGGYLGKDAKLFSVVFQAKNIGTVLVYTENERILLNDGVGSEALVRRKSLSLDIKEISVDQSFSEPLDNELPEIFSIQIAQNSNVFENKWFLVFSTQDKGSGIDRYEILEKEQSGSIWGLIKRAQWNTEKSPYLLSDQNLKKNILVKAVDRAGNERISILPAQNSLTWYENYFVWVIIIIVVLVAIVVWRQRNLKKI